MKERKTAEEKLEIRKFVLESHLYMIQVSFFILSLSGAIMYFILAMAYFQDSMESSYFITTTVVFIILIIFSLLGYGSINDQKSSISRLSTIFKVPSQQESKDV